MTAKEKAKELFSKYYNDITSFMSEEQAKKCAIIAVDEILSLNAESFDEPNNPHYYYSKTWWQQVKKEINSF